MSHKGVSPCEHVPCLQLPFSLGAGRSPADPNRPYVLSLERAPLAETQPTEEVRTALPSSAKTASTLLKKLRAGSQMG